jgi:hypothetical protein
MAIRLKGVLHGRRIDLETDPGLPEGSAVEVTIEDGALNLGGRREELKALAGVWQTDDGLDSIFQSIIENRLETRPRSSDFDAAS